MVVSQTVELATKDNRWDGPTPFTVQAQKVERGNTSERYTACVADSGTCHGPTPGVNLPLSAVQAHNGRGGMACGCAEEGGTPGQRRSLGWTYPFSLHRHRRGMGQDYHCPLFTVLAQKGGDTTLGVVLKSAELVTKDNHCPPFIAQSTDGVDRQDLVTKDHHHCPLSTGQTQVGWMGKTCGCTEDRGTHNTKNNLSDGPPCLARQQFGILFSQTC